MKSKTTYGLMCILAMISTIGFGTILYYAVKEKAWFGYTSGVLFATASSMFFVAVFYDSYKHQR